MNKFKKQIAVVLAVLTVALSFAACSSSQETEDTTADASQTSAEAQSTSGEANVHSEYSDSEKDISDASITESEATDMIKALSEEQLGLEGSKESYKFMVGTTGKVIDGKDYIEVIAAVVSEENEDGTVNIDTRGTYYISYDGKQILAKDSTTGELREIKQ